MPSIKCYPTRGFYIEKYTNKKPMPDMHYHRTYELYYTIEGERDYFVGDRYFKVRKNDLVYIPPGILHRTEGKGATRFLLYFSRRFAERFFTEETLMNILPDMPFVFRPPEHDKRLHDAFAALLYDFGEQERDAELKDEMRLAGGMFRLLYHMRTEQNTYAAHDQAEERISLIVKFINENFATIDSLDQIAERFFISKYHLCHTFKRHLGVPLVTYLNTIRIRAACDLLRKGRGKPADIAAACGFNSTSYFCKVFKDEKGMSPGEYVKNRDY